MKFILSLALLFWLQLISIGCGGYKIPRNITPEERFNLAKRMFQKEDYLDSKSQFRILTLNYPGVKFMDEAQFYLAESHFHLNEYILAADEYRRLVRLYPNSQWVDDAQFKIGLCEYELSPKPSLDQTYTLDAIRSFQRFIEDFPSSDLVPEAERLLNICRGKIAEKEYKTGELYRKLDDHPAALVYYNSVINGYYDTEFAEDALFRKGESLLKLERLEASLAAFEEFVQKYPESGMRGDAVDQIKELRKTLRKAREANGQY